MYPDSQLLENRFEALSETDVDKIEEDEVLEDGVEGEDVLPDPDDPADHEDSYSDDNDS